MQLPDPFHISIVKISNLSDILQLLPSTPLHDLQKLQEAIESEIQHRKTLDTVETEIDDRKTLDAVQSEIDDRKTLDAVESEIDDRKTLDTVETEIDDRKTLDTVESKIDDRKTLDPVETEIDDHKTLDTIESEIDDRKTLDAVESKIDDRKTLDTVEFEIDDRETLDPVETEIDDRKTLDTVECQIDDRETLDTVECQIDDRKTSDTVESEIDDRKTLDTVESEIDDRKTLDTVESEIDYRKTLDTVESEIDDRKTLDTVESEIDDRETLDTVECQIDDRKTLDTVKSEIDDRKTLDTVESEIDYRKTLDTVESEIDDRKTLDTVDSEIDDCKTLDTVESEIDNRSTLDPVESEIDDCKTLDTVESEIDDRTTLDPVESELERRKTRRCRMNCRKTLDPVGSTRKRRKTRSKTLAPVESEIDDRTTLDTVASEVEHPTTLDPVDYIPLFCDQYEIEALMKDCEPLPANSIEASSQCNESYNEHSDPVPQPHHETASVSDVSQPPAKRICFVAGDSHAARVDPAMLDRRKSQVVNVTEEVVRKIPENTQNRWTPTVGVNWVVERVNGKHAAAGLGEIHQRLGKPRPTYIVAKNLWNSKWTQMTAQTAWGAFTPNCMSTTKKAARGLAALWAIKQIILIEAGKRNQPPPQECPTSGVVCVMFMPSNLSSGIASSAAASALQNLPPAQQRVINSVPDLAPGMKSSNQPNNLMSNIAWLTNRQQPMNQNHNVRPMRLPGPRPGNMPQIRARNLMQVNRAGPRNTFNNAGGNLSHMAALSSRIMTNKQGHGPVVPIRTLPEPRVVPLQGFGAQQRVVPLLLQPHTARPPIQPNLDSIRQMQIRLMQISQNVYSSL